MEGVAAEQVLHWTEARQSKTKDPQQEKDSSATTAVQIDGVGFYW